MDIMGTVMSGLFGGGVGLLGTLIGRVFGFLEVREQNKLAVLNNQHELSLLDKQASMQKAEMESEYMIASMETESAMRTASYSHDASYGAVPPAIASILRLVRPVLTLGLLGVFIWIFYKMDQFGHATAMEKLADDVSFLTSAAIFWWFGARDRGNKTKN